MVRVKGGTSSTLAVSQMANFTCVGFLDAVWFCGYDFFFVSALSLVVGYFMLFLFFLLFVVVVVRIFLSPVTIPGVWIVFLLIQL